MLWKTQTILRKLQSAESIKLQGTGLLRDITASFTVFAYRAVPTGFIQWTLRPASLLILLQTEKMWRPKKSCMTRTKAEQDPKCEVIQNLTTEQLTIRGLKWPGIFLEIRHQVNWCLMWKRSTKHKALESDRSVQFWGVLWLSVWL